MYAVNGGSERQKNRVMICGREGELPWVENPPKGAGLVHWLNWPPQVWWAKTQQ